MANDNLIFDNVKIIKHLNYKDIDQAFYDWWDKKLDIRLPSKDGRNFKVPVLFIAQERWHLSREDGLRDENGTLILPIITIIRKELNSPSTGPTARIFADTKEQFAFHRQINDKTSLIANLNAARPTNLDPNSPIYEIYTAPPPKHNEMVFEVKIWTAEMNEMNIILEKYNLELDYNSIKSFQFFTLDKFYFTAFQEESPENESNLEDYSKKERQIRYHLSFRVPAYTLPDSNERPDTFKRYFSQTKLVIKNETELSDEDFKKL